MYIEEIPIPNLDVSNPAEVALHDRVVRHVETLLDLHKRLAALPEHSDRWRATQRQSDQEDAALDALVYQLYGLTDEEIAIVEGR